MTDARAQRSLRVTAGLLAGLALAGCSGFAPDRAGNGAGTGAASTPAATRTPPEAFAPSAPDPPADAPPDGANR